MPLVETKKGTEFMATIEMRKEQERWRVERDLETMIECEKIEKDPKRLAAVQKLAKERLLMLGGIASEGADAS
jgi:hypothetical protein